MIEEIRAVAVSESIPLPIAYIVVAIAALVVLAAEFIFIVCRTDHPRPRENRIATGTIRFTGPTGELMSTLVLKADDVSAPATLGFKDKAGNAASPASPPVWTMTVAGVVSLDVAADGLSAVVKPVGVGSTEIDVVAEGDATPGVNTLHLAGTVQVVAAEIATGEIDFGPATTA